MHISIHLCLCRANRCVCDDGAHCSIGTHVICSIYYLDSRRASYGFSRLGRLFFGCSSRSFSLLPAVPCPFCCYCRLLLSLSLLFPQSSHTTETPGLLISGFVRLVSARGQQIRQHVWRWLCFHSGGFRYR